MRTNRIKMRKEKKPVVLKRTAFAMKMYISMYKNEGN